MSLNDSFVQYAVGNRILGSSPSSPCYAKLVLVSRNRNCSTVQSAAFTLPESYLMFVPSVAGVLSVTHLFFSMKGATRNDWRKREYSVLHVTHLTSSKKRSRRSTSGHHTHPAAGHGTRRGSSFADAFLIGSVFFFAWPFLLFIRPSSTAKLTMWHGAKKRISQRFPATRNWIPTYAGMTRKRCSG